MQKNLFYASIFCLAVLTSSCGVIIGGSKYRGTIMVKDHRNAEIFVNGKQIGIGQAEALLPRNKDLVVEVRAEGCPNQTITYDKAFRTGIFILSGLTTGILGVIIDVSTGAVHKLDHKNDPAVTKITEKNYDIVVDYTDCKKE